MPLPREDLALWKRRVHLDRSAQAIYHPYPSPGYPGPIQVMAAIADPESSSG